MGRRSKQMTIPEIIDKICALEAYEEWLEDQIQKDIFPFKRKEYRNNLVSVRRQLTEYRTMLVTA